jgi:cation diffusion facilitator CzcD-associated flavoprotein CzcO
VHTLETDYLVVGAGAAGMAFADQLLEHSDATVTIVDRRHAPGGHWLNQLDSLGIVKAQPAPSWQIGCRWLTPDHP